MNIPKKKRAQVRAQFRDPSVKQTESERTREIPVNFVIPESVVALNSDNFVVQFQDGLFQLFFFQNQHPFIFNQNDIESVSELKSICTARVGITPFQFAKNLKAMTENFAKFLKMVGSNATNVDEFLKESEKDANHEKVD